METLCHIEIGNVSYASVAAWTNNVDGARKRRFPSGMTNNCGRTLISTLRWAREGGCLELDQFGLGQQGWAEYGGVGQRPMQHGNFVAGIQARAVAAVFVDLVGQRGAVFNAKTEMREELRDAGEEADAGDALMFCFAHERAEKLPACA